MWVFVWDYTLYDAMAGAMEPMDVMETNISDGICLPES